VPRIARGTHWATGDAGAVDAIRIATLGRVRALGAIAAAIRADTLETHTVAAIGGGGAGAAGVVAGATRAVDAHGLAVEETALAADSARAAGRLALAQAVETGTDAAIRITGAGDPIRSTGIRQHLCASRARCVAGVSQATLVVGLAGAWIGALGASRVVS